jgi:DNA-binding XRE family transcriptional regulator
MINSERTKNLEEIKKTRPGRNPLFLSFINFFSKYNISLDKILDIYKISFGWMKDPGTIIKKLRIELGLSQNELGKELGKCQSTISRIESNEDYSSFSTFKDAYSYLLSKKFKNSHFSD